MNDQFINKWDKRFLELSRLVGNWSKDPSTKIGCVIAKGKFIKSIGFNGYPSGIKDNPKDSRDLKLSKTIHAEVNAIINARGDVKNCTLYTTPFPPCDKCGALIVQSGISRIVVGLQHNLDFARWQQYIDIAQDMFIDAGIIVDRMYMKSEGKDY